MILPSKNFILVHVAKQYTTTVKCGDGELMIDPMFRPMHNLIYNGVVEAVSADTELPVNHFGEKLHRTLQKGDLVYFRCINNETDLVRIPKEITGIEDGFILRIPYCDVFAYQRNGETFAINGYILGERVLEGEGEVEIAENGVKRRVKYLNKALNIAESYTDTFDKNKAIVRHISTLYGQESELEVGDLVYGLKGQSPGYWPLAFENTVGDETFYCFFEEYVGCKLN